MASLRGLKKDIDYLVEEVLADCYLTIYFHPEKKEKVVEVMRKAVDARNSLVERANRPAEKNNPSLVRKHYSQLRRDLFENVEGLFTELSSVNKK